MIAIIAEKPSVARDIANNIGATNRETGYLYGNGYKVTWALGHLVSLAMPDEYGIKGFKKEMLPIIPQPFKLVARDSSTQEQLKIINKIFKECDSIIVATDAGREGELIFRYIYEYLDCKKPFKRLWISSLTEKSIREGLSNLKDGNHYDNLYYAAKARSEADWLVGINATQAITIAAAEGCYSLGRVQTPTLTMICDRYVENTNFVSHKYWQLSVCTTKDNIFIKTTSNNKFDNKEEAENLYEKLKKNNEVIVEKVENKEIKQNPPLLYNLTTLQKEANTKHSFSADKTLGIAQKLYEMKAISYPRTDSRYLPNDVFSEINRTLNLIAKHSRFGKYIPLLQEINAISVNDEKVTDHHAIIITPNFPPILSADEKIIYHMIMGRMVESFSPICIKNASNITITCNDIVFSTQMTNIIDKGWRVVFEEENKEDNNALPLLTEGEKLPIQGCGLTEANTKPKPIHTESTLLSSMENAGCELKDAEERNAIRECGIGTSATRAAIIETLLNRNYIERDNKSLIPTKKGLAIYDTVKTMKIADVQMTALWESALSKIESGEMNADTFRKSIEIYASQITNELLQSKITSILPKSDAIICPKCKKGKMIFYNNVVKCNNSECNLPIFYTKSEKKLTDSQIKELISKGQTSIIKNFKSKNGKTFDAQLAFDKNFNPVFIFPKK